jgi:flagellar hook-associated protein 3 FlgL
VSFNSIGDLASNVMLNQASIRVKRSLMQLSQELTTGVTSDVRSTLRNDLTHQMDWEHRLLANSVQDKTLSEALVKIQAKQSVLGSINDTIVSFANSVETTGIGSAVASTNVLSKNAKTLLEQVVSQLNTRAAGQTLFAGTDTDLVSMASVEDTMTSVKASIGPVATVDDVVQGVKDWMNDPVAGYQAIAYLGSTDDPSPIRLTSNRTISETSKADHEALQAVVENLILATLSSDETFAPSEIIQVDLLQTSSNGLRSADASLIELRASLGFVEAELERQKVKTSAETSTLEQLRANVLGIDEYEVASKLQETELQLEKIYAMTARSARMSLLEYLQ